MFRLLGQVDIIVTDSPLLLTPIYAPELTTLTKLAMEETNKLTCLNVFISRKKKYNPHGRNQTRAQSIQIDKKIKSFLTNHKVPYIEIVATKNSIKHIVDKAIKLLKKVSQFHNLWNWLTFFMSWTAW